MLNSTAPPGAEEGEHFTDFGIPYVTPDGKVVFDANAGTGQFNRDFEGVWMGDETNLDLLVSTRDSLPGFDSEARIASLSPTTSRGEDNLLFLSTVRSAVSPRELVLWNIENGDLELISRASDFAPSPNTIDRAATTG